MVYPRAGRPSRNENKGVNDKPMTKIGTLIIGKSK